MSDRQAQFWSGPQDRSMNGVIWLVPFKEVGQALVDGHAHSVESYHHVAVRQYGKWLGRWPSKLGDEFEEASPFRRLDRGIRVIRHQGGDSCGISSRDEKFGTVEGVKTGGYGLCRVADLVSLANQMVTEFRQRVTRTRLGRRGTTVGRVWNNRLLLLTGADHLSDRQWDRLMAGFDTTIVTADPTGELGAAWGVKERLRLLLGEHEPSKIRWRLADCYDTVITADMAEATRLGATIQTWWPAILVALTEQVTNARTEGSTGSSSRSNAWAAATGT